MYLWKKEDALKCCIKNIRNVTGNAKITHSCNFSLFSASKSEGIMLTLKKSYDKSKNFNIVDISGINDKWIEEIAKNKSSNRQPPRELQDTPVLLLRWSSTCLRSSTNPKTRSICAGHPPYGCVWLYSLIEFYWSPVSDSLPQKAHKKGTWRA